MAYRAHDRHMRALGAMQPTLNLAQMEEAAESKRKISQLNKEMAAVHQEKERIRTITQENRKLIERLVETKPLLDNKEPRKKAGYHVMSSSSKNKARRIESLNLITRLKESERI